MQTSVNIQLSISLEMRSAFLSYFLSNNNIFKLFMIQKIIIFIISIII